MHLARRTSDIDLLGGVDIGATAVKRIGCHLPGNARRQFSARFKPRPDEHPGPNAQVPCPELASPPRAVVTEIQMTTHSSQQPVPGPERYGRPCAGRAVRQGRELAAVLHLLDLCLARRGRRGLGPSPRPGLRGGTAGLRQAPVKRPGAAAPPRHANPGNPAVTAAPCSATVTQPDHGHTMIKNKLHGIWGYGVTFTTLVSPMLHPPGRVLNVLPPPGCAFADSMAVVHDGLARITLITYAPAPSVPMY
jgi:hypothetical protein